MSSPVIAAPPARSWLAAGLSLGLVAILGATAVGPGATVVQAAPAAPDPVVLYQEDFESGSSDLLATYTGVNGEQFTGADAWLDASGCNGFIVAYADTTRPPTYCSRSALPDYSYNNLRFKAKALGTLRDEATAGTNHVLASETASTDPIRDLVQFATTTPLSLPASNGRFITFSVDAAATACRVAPAPLLRFYLSDSLGVETPISSGPINPCVDPSAQIVNVDGTETWVGSYSADSSILQTGSSLGIVLRNEQLSGQGNDGAIDNIRVMDVTPQVSIHVPAQVPVGTAFPVTFRIVNTSELSAKSGWEFGSILPAGLSIADGTVGSTCGAVVVAPENGTSVAVSTGTLVAGEETCDITVPAVSSTEGTYSFGPSRFSRTTGLDATSAAPSTRASYPTYTTAVSADVVRADAGDEVALTWSAANTGHLDYALQRFEVDLTDVLDDGTLVGDLPYGWTLTDGILHADLPLNRGMEARYTFVVRVNATPTGNGTLRARALTDTEAGGSCTSCAAVTHVPAYRASIAADAATVIGSAAVTYTVTLRNSGTAPFDETAPLRYSVDLTDVLDDAVIVGELPIGASLHAGILTGSTTVAVGREATATITVRPDAHASVATSPIDAALTAVGIAAASSGNGRLVAALTPITLGGVCDGGCAASTTVRPQAADGPGLTVHTGGLERADHTPAAVLLFGGLSLLVLTLLLTVLARRGARG